MFERISDIAALAVRGLPEENERIVRERIKRSKSRVKLGIITALPKEAAAVAEVLGGSCIELPVDRRTHVTYYLHEFRSTRGDERLEVIVGLANQMGNNSAAVTAASLLMDYIGVDNIIITGIAGGIPAPSSPGRHVRLGDIVVGLTGVLQYDFRKQELGHTELRRMTMPASAKLTAAIRQIQVEEAQQIFEFERFLHPFHHKRPRRDVLHKARDGSGGLEERVRHPRQASRRPKQPLVHYGVIGSANVLLKDQAERDRLAREYKLQAIEMEGSGIADAAWNFATGYIAIRAICDYCDMHKADEWQEYAALAAAAYTRAVVERTLSTEPQLSSRPSLIL